MFDLYAFADYSGAASAREQRKHIAWCVAEREGAEVTVENGAARNVGTSSGDKVQTDYMESVVSGMTRAELTEAAGQLLERAERLGRRVLLGFDHNYSFPFGFYEAATGRPIREWRELLDWVADTLEETAEEASDGGRSDIRPREWAAGVNRLVAERLGTQEGPFWGPHFTPKRRLFPFERLADVLPERRATEGRRPGMKSVYQLGGAGSVGLQSLFGLVQLRRLLRFCAQRRIPLHVWPFDGWTPPAKAHVLVEVYPTLCIAELDKPVTVKRTDMGDAVACVQWAREQDAAGRLQEWLEAPTVNGSDRERARLEGWVLGT